MSINYHAWQNRGVRFSNHEALSEQWWEQFRGYDPRRICRILGFTADEKYLYINYLGTEFRLVLATGHLEKQAGEKWCTEPEFNEAMVIYHLLYYVQDAPLVTGKWVLSDSLEKVLSGRPRLADPLYDTFTRRFSGRMEELSQRCEAAGGIKTECGDAGYEFTVFPFMKLRLVFWDVEDDFPAQVQIMVDDHITDYIHCETVGCVISDLFEIIESIDTDEP